jgi:hypothetical protein
MPWIDDRGRIFGRLNIVDALVAGFLIVLVPLAYVGYLLFRTPTPRLTAIEPATVKSGGDQRIQASGENFRPYLRITFNTIKARSFLLADFTKADVGVPDLPPGRYDVVLYDEARELGRLAGALTVVPPFVPRSATLRVGGKFRGLGPENADMLKAGVKLGDQGIEPIAEILGAATPASEERWLDAGDSTMSIPVERQRQVAATLRLGCRLDGRVCKVGESTIAPRATIELPDSKGGHVSFYIEEVGPDRDPVDLQADVRFLTTPAVVPLVRLGDRDTAGVSRPVAMAWLTAAPVAQTLSGQASIETQISAGPQVQRFGATVAEPIAVIDVPVHIRADETPFGWTFKGQQVKAGGMFTFDGGRYVMRGWIRSVKRSDQPISTPE